MAAAWIFIYLVKQGCVWPPYNKKLAVVDNDVVLKGLVARVSLHWRW